MFYRPWKLAQIDMKTAAALSQTTALPRLVCEVLCARGKTTPEAAAEMKGDAATLSDAMLIKNMDKAVERILAAVDSGERIAVFGDYDVDGVTATALLYLYLDSIGAEVYYKLPNRDDDGYGLSADAVDLMADKKVKLIITVDNGVSANEAIDRANERGVDVVVTDHHLPPENLPNAVAIVDPKLDGDASASSSLCGAGVAFKLVCALEGCDASEMLPFYGDLAAIGTIADIMPLEGENRTIVKAGLALLQRSEHAGLAALIESCGLEGKPITAENVSFAIGPRLNAAGRMDSATDALELLLCEDEDDAAERCRILSGQNAARQKTEQDISTQVIEKISSDASYQSDRILIVSGAGWHQGVIGIVASRIVDKFGKPAIIISVDENGEGKGSGRSIDGFSLYNAISSCSDLLLTFGGHALAAGLSLKADNIEAFRKNINEWAAGEYPTLSRPALKLDVPVTLEKITTEDVAALDILAPYGNKNPQPVFLLENATIDGIYPVSDGKHCRIRFRQGSAVIYAVLFGQSPASLCYAQGDEVDAAITLSVYSGKAGDMISGRVKELRPSHLSEEYIKQCEYFEALCCGTVLTNEQTAALLPTRNDAIAAYKAVLSAQGGLKADDLRPLFKTLGADKAGKTLVSLKALEQLELVKLDKDSAGATRYTAVPQAKGVKKDLMSAAIIESLA